MSRPVTGSLSGMTASPATHTLATPGGVLAYDVRGPLPTADGRPPLLLIGHPMDAGGFAALADQFEDRTVVTYDPRGLGRSTRTDGRSERTPEDNAADVHAVVEAVGGPVDLFGSSGGAIVGLALVAAHPEDVRVLVAHEPPLLALLPDAERAFAAERRVAADYQARGWGHGMARFIALASWQGPFTEAYDALPDPDPAAFGLPADDDGARSDPLLSGVSSAITAYRPDVEAVTAAPARIVVGVGVESTGILTGRTSLALAEALGEPVVEFPGGHGGFLPPEWGQPSDPPAFAAVLRRVLEG